MKQLCKKIINYIREATSNSKVDVITIHIVSMPLLSYFLIFICAEDFEEDIDCLLYTSPSPRDRG